MTAIVTFWKVKEAKQKISCVCTLVHRFFQQAQRQLILVPNQEVAEYVDKLIWKFPKESFIPHTISFQPLQAAVVITTCAENINRATILLNLCPQSSSLGQSVNQIHELFDLSDSSKERLSSERKKAYEKQGLVVSVCPWN